MRRSAPTTPSTTTKKGGWKMGVRFKVGESKTGNWRAVEEGLYIAKLVEVKPDTINVRGEERDIIRWRFVILEEKDKPMVEGLTSTLFTTRSKAYKWASALLGYQPDVGEEIDTDELIGKYAIVKVENKERNGRVFSRVTDVIKAKKRELEQAKELDVEEEGEEEVEEEEEPIDVQEEEEEEEEEEVEIKPKKKKKKIKLK